MGRNMDEDTDKAALAREHLQYWHDNLDLADGKSWLKRQSLIHVYGAFTPNGEVDAAMMVYCDPAEMQLMSVKLSSVSCEVKIVLLAVETILHKLGSDTVGGEMIV